MKKIADLNVIIQETRNANKLAKASDTQFSKSGLDSNNPIARVVSNSDISSVNIINPN